MIEGFGELVEIADQVIIRRPHGGRALQRREQIAGNRIVRREFHLRLSASNGRFLVAVAAERMQGRLGDLVDVLGMLTGRIGIDHQRLIERALDQRLEENDQRIFLHDLGFARPHADLRCIGFCSSRNIAQQIERFAKAGMDERIPVAEQDTPTKGFSRLRQLLVLEVENAEPDPGVMQFRIEVNRVQKGAFGIAILTDFTMDARKRQPPARLFSIEFKRQHQGRARILRQSARIACSGEIGEQ